MDRLGELALEGGAQNYEVPQDCLDYTQPYYATFFEDASGNKLEICCRT